VLECRAPLADLEPKSRHFLADFESVRSKAVVGGLHHLSSWNDRNFNE
jgi:hypothetical protein